MPTVSVIIPTYNRAATLRQAVDSALGQTFTDLELIIVDDASTDMTDIVLEDLKAGDARVRVIRHQTNEGAAAARNTGIINAQGEYIALLDSDDLWLAEKLNRQMEHILTSQADVCICNSFYRNPRSGQLASREHPPVPDWDRMILEGKGMSPGSTMIAARHLFAPQSVGLFDETMPRLEDWDWFIRLRLYGGSITNCPYTGAIIRVGSPPSIEAVEQSAATLKSKHEKPLAEREAQRANVFPAALLLERCAVRFWHKKLGGFLSLWLKALFTCPPLAMKFMLTRVVRALTGDAPRLYALLMPYKK